MADEYPDMLKTPESVEAAKAYLRRGDTVEFYEHIASSLMAYKPADPVRYCLDYVDRLVREHEQGRTFPPDEAPAKEAPSSPSEDTAYSRRHRVSRFLDRWILALLSEQCDVNQPDPYVARSVRLQFHVEYLTAKLAEAKSPPPAAAARGEMGM